MTLNMKASLSSFDLAGLKRIAQLISKTNQFNLTTYRYSEDEVNKMINNKDYHTLQVRLSDNFSDHGVVSIVICRKKENEWLIDLWVMSCRVFGRKLEHAIFGAIVKNARLNNVTKLTGKFIPTKRNQIVRNLYKELGFSRISIDNNNVDYCLDISDLSPKHSNVDIEMIQL